MSDIFNDSELSNSKLKRKRDNTGPSWALAKFAADDTRQQSDKDKKNQARKYIEGFQKQHRLSDKALSFIMGIARALAMHAVVSPLDTGVLDLLQCKIVLKASERWNETTGLDERFLGFGIKCPPDTPGMPGMKIDYEVVRELTKKIFQDVYNDPRNLYLPAKVEFALWEKTGCPVVPDDLKTKYNAFGWTDLGSEDERFCAGLELRRAVPLQKLFLSYITLYE